MSHSAPQVFRDEVTGERWYWSAAEGCKVYEARNGQVKRVYPNGYVEYTSAQQVATTQHNVQQQNAQLAPAPYPSSVNLSQSHNSYQPDQRMLEVTRSSSNSIPIPIPARIGSNNPQVSVSPPSVARSPSYGSPYNAAAVDTRPTPRPTAYPPSALPAQFGQLALENRPEGHSAPQSASQDARDTRVQQLQGRDRTGKIQSIVEVGDSAVLTDPDLYREGFKAHKKIIETSGLRSTFKRRDRSFFREGKVFRVLWIEPMGGGNHTPYAATDSRWGEPYHAKPRIFVVIRQGQGTNYCSAIAVWTYDGQGVAKANVKKSEHAIIFTGKERPQPSLAELPKRGEAGMQPIPIRVDPDRRDGRLDPMSRLNFGKVYTVEHNVKAESFGAVHREFLPHLIYQWRVVWAQPSVTGSVNAVVPAAQVPNSNTAIAGPSSGQSYENSAPQPVQVRNPQQAARTLGNAVKEDPRYRMLLAAHGQQHAEVAKDPRYHSLLAAIRQELAQSDESDESDNIDA